MSAQGAIAGRAPLAESATGVREYCSVDVAGESIAFRLVHTARRRHAHLFVDGERGVEVRAAPGFGIADAMEFVAVHGDWVRRRTAEIARSRRPLVSGACLPLLDEQLTLRVCNADAQLSLLDPAPAPATRTRRVRQRTRREGRHLTVVTDRAGTDGVRDRLVDWYRRTAAELLPDRTRQLAARVGREPSKVRVKAQRSMWGSCTVDGEISLNWRLLLVPARLADYVIVHELCHLAHHDHSPRFWALVERTVPDFQERRAELRDLQHRLPI